MSSARKYGFLIFLSFYGVSNVFAITKTRHEIHIAKTLKPTSIRHRSDAFASDRCLIQVNPRLFAIWAYGKGNKKHTHKKRHYMQTLSELLSGWEGNSPVTRGFSSQNGRSLMFSLFFSLKGLLNNYSSCLRFEIPWISRDIILMIWRPSH